MGKVGNVEVLKYPGYECWGVIGGLKVGQGGGGGSPLPPNIHCAPTSGGILSKAHYQ